MTYAATGYNVVLKVLPPGEEVTLGGVILPDVVEVRAVGTALSVGPDVTAVKVGQRVLFQPYLALEVWREGGDTLVIVEEWNIYAAVEERKENGG